MERVHTHEVDSREIEGERACSAFTELKNSGICSKILDFFSHCQSFFL